MKKIVSKILPVSLLVLAMILSSVAVSAEELSQRNVTYTEDGNIVSVEATAVNASAGDAVILATRQDGELSAAALDIDEAAESIVYVDQASADSINFKFIPKANIPGNTISVFMGGAGATVSVDHITTNNVFMHANGGTVSGAGIVDKGEGVYAYNRPAVEPVVYVLPNPTPSKAGFAFEGWYTNADFTSDKVTEIAANITGNIDVYAKYTANASYASDTGYCTYEEEPEVKIGVISVTAKLEEYASATKYGFLVYRAEENTETVDIQANAGSLDANGFYTVVYGIPSDNFTEEIVIIPYIIDAQNNATYGAVQKYSVGATPKYLGTVETLETELGIKEEASNVPAAE